MRRARRERRIQAIRNRKVTPDFNVRTGYKLQTRACQEGGKFALLVGPGAVPIGGASGRTPRADGGGARAKPGTAMRKGREFVLSEVKLKKGEPIDRALRRLKKKVDRENTIKDVRQKRHYEKPSERRRRKLKAARFSAYLAAKYSDI